MSTQPDTVAEQATPNVVVKAAKPQADPIATQVLVAMIKEQQLFSPEGLLVEGLDSGFKLSNGETSCVAYKVVPAPCVQYEFLANLPEGNILFGGIEVALSSMPKVLQKMHLDHLEGKAVAAKTEVDALEDDVNVDEPLPEEGSGHFHQNPKHDSVGGVLHSASGPIQRRPSWGTPPVNVPAPDQSIDDVVDVSTPTTNAPQAEQPVEEPVVQTDKGSWKTPVFVVIHVLVIAFCALTLMIAMDTANSDNGTVGESKKLTKEVENLKTENGELKKQLEKAQSKVKEFQATVNEQAEMVKNIEALCEQVEAKLKKFDFVIDIKVEESSAPGHPYADDKGNLQNLIITVDKTKLKLRPVVQLKLAKPGG